MFGVISGLFVLCRLRIGPWDTGDAELCSCFFGLLWAGVCSGVNVGVVSVVGAALIAAGRPCVVGQLVSLVYVDV